MKQSTSPGHRMASALCVALMLSFGAPAMAEPGDGGGPGYSHQDRSNQMRQQSKRSAQRDLGYPIVPYWENYPPEPIDFVGLSIQIQNLAAHLQAMAAGAAAAAAGAQNGPVIPSAAGPSAVTPLSQTYGPEGPTVKSVAMVLDYRLMVAGNPRLKAGETTDEGDSIRTHIVTQEGAIVDVYLVDKKTGAWTRVQ